MAKQQELPEGITFTPEFLNLYKFEAFLGKGAMGAVLLMYQEKMNRKVAVKVVRAEGLTSADSLRLEREARALGAINHQNIVAIYDVGRDADKPYLVCEYVDGGTVADRLQKGPKLTLEQTLRIMIQILSGLKAAHRRKIVHRDLKPANIFLTSNMKVKIGDFGLAKNHKAPDEAGKLTVTGTILGTPAYMSPEQCRGYAVTPASDLYSMGVMLFEMLTGQLPFPGPNVLQFLLQHTNNAPPKLAEVAPELPRALDDIVRKALEKDPGKRFASAGDFRAALQAVLKSLSAPQDATMPGTSVTSVETVPEEPHEESGKVLDGRYHLERLIGEGGMGQVWLAWDDQLESSVAVKLLPPELWRDPEAQANLRQEAKHSAKLAHSNIVKLMTLQAGRDGEPSFLVMEYVSGPTLAGELARRKTNDLGPFSPEEALPIIEGLASGLEHAHQKSIIHRDIKPSNVLLEPLPNGTFIPKLADFGIAAEASSFRTRATGAMPSGTLAYMSPEQQACQKLDGRADLYSVAATLYQMLTYAPPFVGGNVAYAIEHAPVPRPENVPPRIADFLERALSKRREERPETPRQFVAEYRLALGMDAGAWATAGVSAYMPRPSPADKAAGTASGEIVPRTEVPIPQTAQGGALPPIDSGIDKTMPPAAPRRSRTGLVVGAALVVTLVGIGATQLPWGQPEPQPSGSVSPAPTLVALVPPSPAATPVAPASIATPRPSVSATPSPRSSPSPAVPSRIEQLQAAAKSGDLKARLELGRLYSTGGEGLPQDDKKAYYYYRMAANSEDHKAETLVGEMFLNGRGVEKDELVAAGWFRKAAKHEPSAAWALADLLLKKLVLPMGDEKASTFLTMAAEGGDARAQAALGSLFANGRDVAKNDALAASYYRKAADQGHARGQCGLAFMLERGRGVKEDKGAAFKLYELAAKQNDAVAMLHLGLCYRSGSGVPPDEARAIEWLEKAAEGGQHAAELVLAEMHFNRPKPDYARALSWYEKAAHRGHRDAQYLMAMMIADGLGTRADREAARTWCEKAQKQGQPDAARWLAAESARVSAK